MDLKFKIAEIITQTHKTPFEQSDEILQLFTNNTQALQLKQTGVMWRCSRQFRMKDTKEVCFKNGGLYEQVKEQPLTLKDEDGIAHELAPHWVKWFHNAT
jgi:hypothetical protein